MGDFHVFDQFRAVKFEEVWAGFPEEVIMIEESFAIFCFVVKDSLFELFCGGGEDVVGRSRRFGVFLWRWSNGKFSGRCCH